MAEYLGQVVNSITNSNSNAITSYKQTLCVLQFPVYFTYSS